MPRDVDQAADRRPRRPRPPVAQDGGGGVARAAPARRRARARRGAPQDLGAPLPRRQLAPLGRLFRRRRRRRRGRRFRRRGRRGRRCRRRPRRPPGRVLRDLPAAAAHGRGGRLRRVRRPSCGGRSLPQPSTSCLPHPARPSHRHANVSARHTPEPVFRGTSPAFTRPVRLWPRDARLAPLGRLPHTPRPCCAHDAGTSG